MQRRTMATHHALKPANCAIGLVCILTIAQISAIFGQGVKGGNGGGGSSKLAFNQQSSTTQQQRQIPINTSGQLSSTFVQMFNSLTPVQQQQFIRQMSSSNKRIFQQAVQPQTISLFNEEVNTSDNSLGHAGLVSDGATKSASKSFSSSQQQVLSPIQQQAAIFKQQQSKTSFVQPTFVQPSSQFSFSRQISSQVQPQIITVPQQASNNEANFQSTQTVLVQPQPQPQQQNTYFNRVEQTKQVAQPIVLPSSESSFKRVQSFSRQQQQPITVPVTNEAAGFSSQQFVQQQVQQQPIQASSFNQRIQQTQLLNESPQPITTTTGFNRFLSSSSSSNLAGNGLVDLGSLQQEKLDVGNLSDGFGSQQQNKQQSVQQTAQLSQPISNSEFESSFTSSNVGFDVNDAQQKNIVIPDDFYNGAGLTAASINNRWYIMKPVENPSAFGLDEAKDIIGGLKQLAVSRNLIGKQRSAALSPATSQTISSSTATTSAPVVSVSPTNVTSTPKKRSTAITNNVNQNMKDTTGVVTSNEPVSLETVESNESASLLDERRK